jgi:hypothetical protein
MGRHAAIAIDPPRQRSDCVLALKSVEWMTPLRHGAAAVGDAKAASRSKCVTTDPPRPA